MATMKDVAKLAGVSTTAVSHVINGTKKLGDNTTQRILDAIKQTKYAPHTLAKSLRMGTTQTIGILVEDIRVLPITEIVNGIGECLEERGFQMLLSDLRMLEKLYNQFDHIHDYREFINQGIALMLHSHVDGIIYVGMHDRYLSSIIDPIDKPIVYAYSHGSSSDHYVTYDNIQGAVHAVKCLIYHGHHRIGLIAGHPNSFPTHQRMEGFYYAMKNAGIPVEDNYICYGDWEYASGYQNTKRLLTQSNPPTAIFAMNDLMAAGCLNAAHEAGLGVPYDLSIVGFDNREISRYLSVPLTTIQLPTVEIGYKSAQMILSLQDGNPVNQNRIILPCSLLERSSVAYKK